MLTRRSWLLGTGTAALASFLPARSIAARSVEPFVATPALLCAAARRGLADRLGPALSPLPYTERLERELGILVGNPIAVRKLLVLHDLASFARSSDIEIGAGLGSSPGSLVCWALGITDLDPVRHELLFERFYDPAATHGPFVDLEVCQRRRDELVEHLIARHGIDHVALERSPPADLEPHDDSALWFESRKVLVAQTSLAPDATRTGRWPTVDLGTWERHECVTFELRGQDLLTELADAGIGAPDPDGRVWNLLASGRPLDHYPLYDDGFPELSQRVRPQSLEDLAAALALYRPGTLEAGWVDYFVDAKHCRRTIEPLPPIVAMIVAPTYGLIVYQEQLMRIASHMTGMSLTDANRLRRDLAARRQLEQHREHFIAHARHRGAAASVFARLQHDAPYTFSRAHALSLATLALRSMHRLV